LLLIPEEKKGAFSYPEVKKIAPYTFAYNESLRTVCLTQQNMEVEIQISSDATIISFPNVEKIEYRSFMCCENLVEITFPEVRIIEEDAFLDCINLQRIILPKVTFIDLGTFWNCRRLKSVALPKNDTTVERFGGFDTDINVSTHPVSENIYLLPDNIRVDIARRKQIHVTWL